MTWKQYADTDYYDINPGPRKTAKTYWDEKTSQWNKVNLWSVACTAENEKWLKINYPSYAGDRILGWYKTINNVVMSEKIYLHYCLTKS